MTRRPARQRLRRMTTVVVAAGLAFGTAACGTATDALVGLEPAPSESAAAAPLDADGAAVIAARLLDARLAAAAAKGEEGEKARAEVLTGDALTVADRAAAMGVTDPRAEQLTKEAEPTVLAQSRGRDWPRAILATTLDATSNTQFLHVMVSEAPEDPFKITSTVAMLGGAELPALGSANAGAPFVDPEVGDGLVLSPAKAFGQYAAALARPAPKKAPASVAADDAFAAALRDSASRQAKALGKLGTLKQEHKPYLDDAVAFRLADGGVVAFGLLRRTDTIAVREGAKELVLPSDLAKLVGKKRVQKSVELTSLEPVVLVVPTEGDVSVIGASDLLYRGKGS